MQTITTKYVGPGNVQGSRIIAQASGGARVIMSYDDALSSEDNHKLAAQEVMLRCMWSGEMIGGQNRDNSYTFVFINSDMRVTGYQPR